MAKKRKKKGLTPNQKLFCDEWLKDRNGTKAYLRAYPTVKKEKTARESASRLLSTNVNVKAYTKARLKKLAGKAQVDQEWVLERFKRLTEYKITDFFDDEGNMKPLSQIPEDTIYAICGLDVDTKTFGEESISFIQKFKLPNKIDVLKALARHLGMFEKDNLQKNPGDALTSLLEKIAGQSKRELGT